MWVSGLLCSAPSYPTILVLSGMRRLVDCKTIPAISPLILTDQQEPKLLSHFAFLTVSSFRIKDALRHCKNTEGPYADQIPSTLKYSSFHESSGFLVQHFSPQFKSIDHLLFILYLKPSVCLLRDSNGSVSQKIMRNVSTDIGGFGESE